MHELLPCELLVNCSCPVMMAGCVLVCSTSKCRRMHCKHGRAANVSLGSHASQRRSDRKPCASHKLLPSVALAVMMAGCVLVCSTFKCRRMHCKHVDAANWTLRCKATTPRSTNGVNMSFLALCSLWKGGEYEGSCPDLTMIWLACSGTMSCPHLVLFAPCALHV